jgi:two-component system OmpR family sensor kinase
LEEALAVETRRSAEIAHALRTPVAVLVARVDALPHGNQAAKLRADIAALARTVEQVLASARAEGMSEAHAEPMDLRSAAESVVSKLAPFAYDHGVELSLDAPADPVLALAIPEAVELALLNLVENAVVHGGQSPVRVTVGPQACIKVQDSGPGLPESWEARMFQPFWRGPQAVPGGSGLGLSIVSRLQRIQGGQVLARDVDPNGAEFELIWPLAS